MTPSTPPAALDKALAARILQAVDARFDAQLAFTRILCGFRRCAGRSTRRRTFCTKRCASAVFDGPLEDRREGHRIASRVWPGDGVIRECLQCGRRLSSRSTDWPFAHPERTHRRGAHRAGRDLEPLALGTGHRGRMDAWPRRGGYEAGLAANLYAYDAVRAAGLLPGAPISIGCGRGMHRQWRAGGAAARLSGRCRDHSRARREHAGARQCGRALVQGARPGAPTHTREMANGFNAIDAAYAAIEALRASKPGGTNSVIAIVISNTWSIPSTSISARSKAGTGRRRCRPGANSTCARPSIPASRPTRPARKSMIACETRRLIPGSAAGRRK